MNAAVAARVRQLEAERDHRRACARFRAEHRAAQQARIDALLAELVATLSLLPLEQERWPNQYTARSAA